MALGNPGARYLKTRHNAGFILADLLSHEWNFSFQHKSALEADYSVFEKKSKQLGVLKPLTFMNLSGKSLRALYEKNKELKDKMLIVIHDEVDLSLGQIKVKMGGGDAGHNGLKNIREVLGHGDYYRIRLGVGKPIAGSEQALAHYVLENFRKDEDDKLIHMLHGGIAVLEALIWKSLAVAQEVAARMSYKET